MYLTTLLPYGRYAGCRLTDIPTSYLRSVLQHEKAESPLYTLIYTLLEKKAASRVARNDHHLLTPEQNFPFAHQLHRHKLCLATDKQQFTSEKSARKRIREIQISPGANHRRIPKNAYQCEHCDMWHLTSQDFHNKVG